MAIAVTSLDHLVLTVADIGQTVAFYDNALGITDEQFRSGDGSSRTALKFGSQKITCTWQGPSSNQRLEAQFLARPICAF